MLCTMSERLLLICPSLEPGRSGVGDYVRRLAAACVRLGAEVRLVALCDFSLNDQVIQEHQEEAGTEVFCMRIPGEWDWPRRTLLLREWVREWRPDWVSLQFVPFGYQRKGMPFELGTALDFSSGGKPCWQVMFHEVWVGAFIGAPIKLRLLGAVQRWIMQRLLKQLKPAVVHTQAAPHQQLLKALGCQAERLPLFGNIPVLAEGAGEGNRLIFSAPRLAESSVAAHPSEATLIAGLFGVIHPEWQPEPFFSQWIELAEKQGKKPVLVLLGRSGRPPDDLRTLAQRYAPQLAIHALGALPPAQVSQVLQALDFGIATTPWELREKSGSLAAMQDHGLPVMVTRNDWRLRGSATGAMDEGGRCFLIQGGTPLTPAMLRRGLAEEPLPSIAAHFLKRFQTASS
jgi:hypothetical protein